MRKHSKVAIAMAMIAACAMMTASLTSCSKGGSSNENTLVVWDYYGSATPVKPAVEAYKKKHPGVEVDYQVYDYDTFQEKLSTAMSSNSAPDLATIDMTWVPTYASQDLLSDLSKISGEKLNGKPIDGQYSQGAVKAMTYRGHKIALAYDFDAYALYYRRDVLEAKGLKVPTTWDELVHVSKAMAEDSNGDGKPDKYQTQVRPDTFQYSQFLFQNGGSIVDETGKEAAFASPKAVKALDYMKKLLGNGGLLWDDSQGDSTGIPGIADERIGMLINGPYMMGVLKDGVPDQAGKWAVAQAPYVRRPGSYLGGTGLVVPTNAKNPKKAWSLAQFMLMPEQQEMVYSKAGAAPAIKAALQSPELSRPDSFFAGQKPFEVFEKAMETATPFPYVAGWPDIDQEITKAVTSAIQGKKSPKKALEEAAEKSDGALRE